MTVLWCPRCLVPIHLCTGCRPDDLFEPEDQIDPEVRANFYREFGTPPEPVMIDTKEHS